MSREREIRERLDKATWGPWYTGDMLSWLVRSTSFGNIAHTMLEGGPDTQESEANADFIAHAREDIPHLLSIIDEQRAEMERLRSEVRRWKQKYEMADTEW